MARSTLRGIEGGRDVSGMMKNFVALDQQIRRFSGALFSTWPNVSSSGWGWWIQNQTSLLIFSSSIRPPYAETSNGFKLPLL
jgi:hypothetical protein